MEAESLQRGFGRGRRPPLAGTEAELRLPAGASLQQSSQGAERIRLAVSVRSAFSDVEEEDAAGGKDLERRIGPVFDQVRVPAGQNVQERRDSNPKGSRFGETWRTWPKYGVIFVIGNGLP